MNVRFGCWVSKIQFPLSVTVTEDPGFEAVTEVAPVGVETVVE